MCKVNEATLDSDKLNTPAETIMLVGASKDKNVDLYGRSFHAPPLKEYINVMVPETGTLKNGSPFQVFCSEILGIYS